MQTPQTTVWKNDKWGLTWSIRDVDGTYVIGHGGGTVGQISLLTFIPRHKFAIAVFTNADQGGLVTQDVTRRAVKEYLGLELPKPEPIEASEDELAAFVGIYSRPMVELELGMLGGKLAGQITYKYGFPSQDSPPPPAPPPVSMGMCEKDRLLVMNGPFKDATGDVIRNSDGSIGWLRVGGRIHKRQS